MCKPHGSCDTIPRVNGRIDVNGEYGRASATVGTRRFLRDPLGGFVPLDCDIADQNNEFKSVV